MGRSTPENFISRNGPYIHNDRPQDADERPEGFVFVVIFPDVPPEQPEGFMRLVLKSVCCCGAPMQGVTDGARCVARDIESRSQGRIPEGLRIIGLVPAQTQKLSPKQATGCRGGVKVLIQEPRHVLPAVKPLLRPAVIVFREDGRTFQVA